MDVSKFVVVAFALLTALAFPGFSCGDDSALTPCEIVKEKCTRTRNHFGKCFPDEGSKGDACCAENFGLKCAEEMTIEEGMAVDPVFAQAIKCELRAHPNLQSYIDCLPDKSECNMCDRKAWEEADRRDILECPRNVQCLLREIPDLDSLRKCFVKYDRARGDKEAEAKCGF
uniref:DB domain-containing protein n=1 Tax=Globodera pallida TaxID=36090 RepID=A0A183CHF8_GLOPA